MVNEYFAASVGYYISLLVTQSGQRVTEYFGGALCNCLPTAVHARSLSVSFSPAPDSLKEARVVTC